MNQAIREWVTVKSGGIIEIRRPELPTGAKAEVIIMFNDTVEEKPNPPLSSFFGKVKGCFKNGEEAEAFLRSERDAWE